MKPIFVGNPLSLDARINYVQNLSMEIEVKLESEDIIAGIRTITETAFVTLVSLNKNGKSIRVTKLSLKTDEDRIKFEE